MDFSSPRRDMLLLWPPTWLPWCQLQTSNFQQNDVTLHVINMYLQTFVCKSDAAKLLPASISNLLVTTQNTHLMQLVVHLIKKNPPCWDGEQGMHSGKRQTKEITILNDVSLSSVLSKCVRSPALQPAWQFGYTRITSCKGTIEIVTELHNNKKILNEAQY